MFIHYSKLYLYLLQSYSTNYTCLLHQSFKEIYRIYQPLSYIPFGHPVPGHGSSPHVPDRHDAPKERY